MMICICFESFSFLPLFSIICGSDVLHTHKSFLENFYPIKLMNLKCLLGPFMNMS
jgi:hypothetical protein